jgi:CRP-like cAMP-binding protein
METLQRILAEHPFFMDLESEHIELLVGCSANAVYKEGEFLFREGEQADSFFVIRQGKVMVETHLPYKGAVSIKTEETGDVLGWSWMIPPYRWRFDARAIELTRVIKLDGKCLRGKCEDDHHLGYEIMTRFATLIAERLEATRMQLLDLYGND